MKLFSLISFRLQNLNGKIELVNQGDSVYEDVSNGLPLLFEINFASQNPVPKLVAIYKNKREICSGPIGMHNRCFSSLTVDNLYNCCRVATRLDKVQVEVPP